MSFTIRPMVSQDLASIVNIQAQAYPDYFLESAEIINHRLSQSPSTAWVAERDGRVSAYLVAYWSTKGKVNPLNAPFAQAGGGECFYVHDLAIANSAQGFGLGRALYEVAEQAALTRKANLVALLSVQDSAVFWQRFGFREYPDLDMPQQKNVRSYCNDSETAVYMVKDFSGTIHG